jgi:hypothetical protein
LPTFNGKEQVTVPPVEPEPIEPEKIQSPGAYDRPIGVGKLGLLGVASLGGLWAAGALWQVLRWLHLVE